MGNYSGLISACGASQEFLCRDMAAAGCHVPTQNHASRLAFSFAAVWQPAAAKPLHKTMRAASRFLLLRAAKPLHKTLRAASRFLLLRAAKPLHKTLRAASRFLLLRAAKPL